MCMQLCTKTHTHKQMNKKRNNREKNAKMFVSFSTINYTVTTSFNTSLRNTLRRVSFGSPFEKTPSQPWLIFFHSFSLLQLPRLVTTDYYRAKKQCNCATLLIQMVYLRTDIWTENCLIPLFSGLIFFSLRASFANNVIQWHRCLSCWDCHVDLWHGLIRIVYQ